MEDISFNDLALRSELLDAITQLGYERPSPIQAKTIPVAMTGRDIVGLSQTGSGKTAAFTLPALHNIDLNSKQTQILILCPTRELSVQVCQEIHRLGSQMSQLSATPVYGGAPIDRQIKALRKGTQLVVGTPGRIMDHLKRGTLKTDAIRTVILDEADRMLDMGFRDDMETILEQIPGDRQTMFFSATMNKHVQKLIQHFGQDPQTIEIERKELTVSSIDQSYIEVRNRSKTEVLSRLLDLSSIRLGIIFCNTKMMVEECYEALQARGYSVDRLHGDITQQNRDRIFKRFRDGNIELLIATDVAARGLDIDEIDIVFNYDIPQDPEDYVHRIGRTGRAGRSGQAVSFVFGRDIYRLESIERYIKHKIRRDKIPTQEDVEGKQSHKLFQQLKERLENKNFKPQLEFVDRLLDQGHSSTDIASALFTMLREEQSRTTDEIIEDTDSSSSFPTSKRGKAGKGSLRGGDRKGKSRIPRGNFSKRGKNRDERPSRGVKRSKNRQEFSSKKERDDFVKAKSLGKSASKAKNKNKPHFERLLKPRKAKTSDS